MNFMKCILERSDSCLPFNLSLRNLERENVIFLMHAFMFPDLPFNMSYRKTCLCCDLAYILQEHVPVCIYA